VLSGLLGPIFECGSVYWERYLSVEPCVGTDILVWNGLLRPIFERGAVSWERLLSVERCVWFVFVWCVSVVCVGVCGCVLCVECV